MRHVAETLLNSSQFLRILTRQSTIAHGYKPKSLLNLQPGSTHSHNVKWVNRPRCCRNRKLFKRRIWCPSTNGRRRCLLVLFVDRVFKPVETRICCRFLATKCLRDEDYNPRTVVFLPSSVCHFRIHWCIFIVLLFLAHVCSLCEWFICRSLFPCCPDFTDDRAVIATADMDGF